MKCIWKCAVFAASLTNLCVIQARPQESPRRATQSTFVRTRENTPFRPNSVLFGASYYNEYVPSSLNREQLTKDVALMKEAGFTVVRMGESTWSLWEPSDGVYEFAWMDRVVDAMGKAGIKVIMGTPTYSLPVWLAKSHPEVFARYLGGSTAMYGYRQNMDYDNSVFRKYAKGIIVKLVEHYRDNPNVIGWQVDNETSSYGAANDDVFDGFVSHLKEKFETPEAMNKAWLFNYWGQDVSRWEDMPRRDSASNPSYKLEWTRYQQIRVTRYLAWQVSMVRQLCRPDQFIMTDFGSIIRSDVNEEEVAKVEDVVADNIYFGWQDDFDGEYIALQGAFARSLKHGNYLVTETNAESLGWDSTAQYPPYDGQLRLAAYSHYANGANMVAYWHWATLAGGQETYWGGVVGHDLSVDRPYKEIKRIGTELARVGPELANLRIDNDVAILYSVDSMNALSFMPFAAKASEAWQPGRGPGAYAELVQQLHTALYKANVGTDVVFPDTKDFSQYKLLIIPALYISDDALLERIAKYVKNGGNVLMTFKSGFADQNSLVRSDVAPGPLQPAAGFTYQEYSNLKHSLSLKGDLFHVGAVGNRVSTWAEFLQPTTAQSLVYYDDPFFGQWPAITRNHYERGTLTYEGTVLSTDLQNAVMLNELSLCGIGNTDGELPPTVRVSRGVNEKGKEITYYFNYSHDAIAFLRRGKAGHELLTGKGIEPEAQIDLGPWDVAIIEQD